VATLCAVFEHEDEARTAVQALLDRGVPGEGVRLLRGSPVRDAHDAPHESFAGPREATPMGTFAGSEATDAPTGSFGGGDASHHRLGSFGDVDRDYVDSFPAGVDDVSSVGHHRLVSLLVEAGVERSVAQHDVERLHEGKVLVLASVDDGARGDAETVLGLQRS